MTSTARSGAQDLVARPPGWAPSAVITATCSGCGCPGADRAGVADLEIVWLTWAQGSGRTPERLVAARYCRGCAPTGPLAEVICAACGDGPILSGALAEAGDLVSAAAIDAWLAAGGWRVSWAGRAGPWCPSCARAVHPRRAVRR